MYSQVKCIFSRLLSIFEIGAWRRRECGSTVHVSVESGSEFGALSRVSSKPESMANFAEDWRKWVLGSTRVILISVEQVQGALTHNILRVEFKSGDRWLGAKLCIYRWCSRTANRRRLALYVMGTVCLTSGGTVCYL